MFRLLGFDVRVRTGFLIFLGLIIFLYQDSFGVWLAGSLAVFTLLHELGHAVAARSAGAEASISLDFLAGYTSFRPGPGQVITPRERAMISAAGPLVQIFVSVTILLILGVNPLSFDSVNDSAMSYAIWWAGPVIGLLNLIPVLPLDGGHLVQTGLEVFLGDKALRVMIIASLAVTGATAAFLFGTGRGGFAIFIAFLLLNQFQMLQATSPKRARHNPVNRLGEAEANAWNTGTPGMLEPGQRISPWFQAHRALASGDAAGASKLITDDLRSEQEPKWAPPVAAASSQLSAIVDVLPLDIEPGNLYSGRVLADILLATRHTQRAGQFAVASFGIQHTSPMATIVARSAAAMGETQTALQWLEAAADTSTTESAGYAAMLGNIMDVAPEFGTLRQTPEFQRIRGNLPQSRSATP